jgi:hypothetical protein
MSAVRILWLAAIGGLLCGEAQAHFLFVHITPPAEGGRAAEVYFSERAEAGDPRFIGKIAGTQLWSQTSPGVFQPLKVQKGTDRLRAFLPVSGSVVVIGSCPYGVLARSKQTPFFLRYFPKAIAGNPEELARMQPSSKVPLEITAAVEGDHLRLTALHDGRPIPKAVFHTVAADLSNEELVASDDGQATWKPSAPGRYSVYIRWITREQGHVNGKRYEEIRDFATLAFSWALQRKGADPEAVALFQEALAARAQWTGFPGFTARIAGSVDGRPFTGKVTVAADGTVQLENVEEAAQRWLQDQLESMAMHRGAGAQDEPSDSPKPVLRFAEAADGNHPLGRLLIFEGGRFASSYRVKDRQIAVVNRHAGRQYMTITVLDNDKNAEGKFLPRSYTVQYWDAATGDLNRTETVHDRWQRVGSWDLPTSHTMTIASGAGLTVRTLTLSDLHLLQKAARK